MNYNGWIKDNLMSYVNKGCGIKNNQIWSVDIWEPNLDRIMETIYFLNQKIEKLESVTKTNKHNEEDEKRCLNDAIVKLVDFFLQHHDYFSWHLKADISKIIDQYKVAKND